MIHSTMDRVMPDFETYNRINRERQQEAERRNEQYYAESRARRERDRQRQHEREMSELHHGSNTGLLLTVGVASPVPPLTC